VPSPLPEAREGQQQDLLQPEAWAELPAEPVTVKLCVDALLTMGARLEHASHALAAPKMLHVRTWSTSWHSAVRHAHPNTWKGRCARSARGRC
jgi:hypothetical protein